MRATNSNNNKDIKQNEQILVDTKGLQRMLDCGYTTAVNIGDQATARVQIGRRVFWSIKAIKDYIESTRG